MTIKPHLMLSSVALVCVAWHSSVEGWFEKNPFSTREGPLTREEIRRLASGVNETVGEGLGACLKREATARAETIGDPETLGPATVEWLPVNEWEALDASDKRIVLTQVVSSQAIDPCTRGNGE